MKRFALALGCAAIALTAVASAQTRHDRVIVRHHGGPAFEIDANEDGWVTRDEAAAAADRVFADMDSDNNGRLTSEDRQAHHFEMGLDGDTEVHIRRAEREAEQAERHAERAERHAERAERDAERHMEHHVIIHRGGDDEVDVAAPVPPAPPHPPMFVMVFANSEEADLNGDGALSLDEFRAQHLRFFDASDANRDGRIRYEPPPAPPEPPEPPAPPAPPARPR
jgi:hypothetical protein